MCFFDSVPQCINKGYKVLIQMYVYMYNVVRALYQLCVQSTTTKCCPCKTIDVTIESVFNLSHF